MTFQGKKKKKLLVLPVDTDRILMVVCILGEFVYCVAQLLIKNHCENYYLHAGLF